MVSTLRRLLSNLVKNLTALLYSTEIHLSLQRKFMLKTLFNLFRKMDKNSLETLQQRAEQGDAEAMYQLGRFYHIGEVVEADYDKAMTLYHRANALGYPLAANNIGALYDDMGEPEKSVEWFEQGIRQDDKRATINLGRFYLLGIGVGQDTFKGMQMLEKYDDDGFVLYLLAQVYDGVIGYGVPINYPKALEYYLLAEKNKQDLTNENLMTLYNNLGTLYNAHEDIPTNYAEAQKYLTKAAEMGLPNAMYGLANLHDFRGDKKQAFKWYLKAAENGLIDAYYYVGNAYKRGEGVQQDSQKALKWLELAAEYQMRDAARELAEIYQDGLGNVSQNLEKAKEFYLLAKESGENVERSVQQLQSRLAVRDDFGALLELAKEGNLEAQKDLAMAYVRGDEIEQNYEEAFKWYKAAAEQGDADAQNSLYNRYAKGEGVEQNSEEAMKWLHRSAEQGYGLAYYNLGFEYSSGDLVRKDELEAIKWYKKAAKKDIKEAYYQLGFLYTYSDTIKDYQAARECYELAGGSWNGEAQNELGILHFNGFGTPKDDAKAFLYFQLAAENGSPEGMYNLGAMYDNGFGTKRNSKLAAQWFKKSCEAGYEKACEML